MDISLIQIVIPAASGLAGVAVGSLFTLWGQKVERSSKREDELRKHTADIFASTMVYSAAINQVITREKNGLTGDDLQAVLEKLNNANQTIHDKCAMLSIVDSGVLGKSAVAFSNVIADATHYLHPAEGTGNADGFRNLHNVLEHMDFYRECIAKIARAPRRKRKRIANKLNQEIEARESEMLAGTVS